MEPIQTQFIIEIMGRPAEHVVESMQKVVDEIALDKNIKIKKQEIKPPVPVKNSTVLFVTFAEIEADFLTMDSLFQVVFKYMPSHFEISYPEQVKITNNELNTLVGALIERLHNYEAITRRLLQDQQNFIKKMEAQGIKLVTDKAEEKRPEDNED